MKITNKTNYDTKYLRRLFLACEKHEGTNYQTRRIKIIWARRNCIHGYAYYNSNSVVLKLPKQYRHFEVVDGCTTRDKEFTPLNAKRLAQIYIHETGHNHGLYHKDMQDYWIIDVSWMPDESVPIKQVTIKPKPNIIETRANKAQKKLVKWTGKLNRAKTYVRKYQRQVKYYEKKMAASNVQPAE